MMDEGLHLGEIGIACRRHPKDPAPVAPKRLDAPPFSSNVVISKHNLRYQTNIYSAWLHETPPARRYFPASAAGGHHNVSNQDLILSAISLRRCSRNWS